MWFWLFLKKHFQIFFLIFMHVCMYAVHVCMCGMCVCTWVKAFMWKPKPEPGSMCHHFPISFQQSLSQTQCSPTPYCQSYESACSRDPMPTLSEAGIIRSIYRFQDLNPGLHSYAASTLTSEPLPYLKTKQNKTTQHLNCMHKSTGK